MPEAVPLNGKINFCLAPCSSFTVVTFCFVCMPNLPMSVPGHYDIASSSESLTYFCLQHLTHTLTFKHMFTLESFPWKSGSVLCSGFFVWFFLEVINVHSSMYFLKITSLAHSWILSKTPSDCPWCHRLYFKLESCSDFCF